MPDLTPAAPAPADARARRARIDALFDEVLDRPAEERTAWLAEACADDPALAAEVAALLAAHERTDGLFERTGPAGAAIPAALAAQPAAEPALGDRIGPWRLVALLGRGGMGVVYRVTRDDGQFRQDAALKILTGQQRSPQAIDRFLAERQILASLRHPNIAQLLDGGVDAGGRPWLVMELVEGEPIDRWCDRRRLGLEARCRLMADVCRAIAVAHRSLVVHRDLKPANVFVTEDGVVKLLDFGIAKLLDDAPAAKRLTRTGAALMTPAWASPEQVSGEAITTATDVYGLGLIFYTLLCGRHAHQLGQGSFREIVEAVVSSDPDAPSAAAVQAPPEPERASLAATTTGFAIPPEAIAQARGGLTPTQLRRRLEGDLDRIALTALAKRPERRYASAEALAEDLARHLDGRPVLAQGDDWTYRLRKFVGRNRGAVTALAALLLVLAGTAVASQLQAARVRRALAIAQAEAAKAEEVTQFLLGLFESSDPSMAQGDTLTARDLLARGEARVGSLGTQPIAQGRLLEVLGRVHGLLGDYRRATPLLARAVATLRGALGDAHPDLIAARVRYATLLAAMGEPAAAQGQVDTALAAVARGTTAIDVVQHAGLLNMAARLRFNAGALDSADRLATTALALPRAPGVDDTAIARSHDLLAMGRSMRGEMAAAERYLRLALERRIRLLGPGHGEVLRNRADLAMVLDLAGRSGEAIRIYEEVLPRRVALLGRVHPEVARTRGNLAGAYVMVGRYRQAIVQLDSALAVLRSTLGPTHPMVLYTLSSLAGARLAAGDPAGSAIAAREALAITSALGLDSLATADAMGVLMRAEIERGDRAAVDSVDRALRAWVGARALAAEWRPDSGGLGDAALLRAVGERRLAEGDTAGAIVALERTTALWRRLYSTGGIDVAMMLHRLGAVQRARGNRAAADTLLGEAWRIRRRLLPPDSPLLAATARELVALYDGWGRPAQAEPYRELARGVR